MKREHLLSLWDASPWKTSFPALMSPSSSKVWSCFKFLCA